MWVLWRQITALLVCLSVCLCLGRQSGPSCPPNTPDTDQTHTLILVAAHVTEQPQKANVSTSRVLKKVFFEPFCPIYIIIGFKKVFQ